MLPWREEFESSGLVLGVRSLCLVDFARDARSLADTLLRPDFAVRASSVSTWSLESVGLMALT